ncbi:hypothetical protein [Ktedonospora formicarum]|uniref:Uncharacterized protein n=1 Tax=Ktedonospora formicarum TaxID=2778364 RepID=A0A8J3I9V3_9CHLR|nr:hypothetical protein [Ktedonospora formicarum]GHO48667.1 hypothetical protein KSX_68300 [Ktedonospora formicarum]
MLDTLTDSGFLQAHHDRYQMHPLVQAYAAMSLEQIPHDQHHAHTRYLLYAMLLLEGQDDSVFQREEAVVQAAFDLAWSLNAQPQALRLTALLTSFWLRDHRWEQAEAAFSRALPIARSHTPCDAITILLGRGRCWLALHHIEKSIQDYQEALILTRIHGSREEQLTLLLQLAAVLMQTPRHGLYQPYAQKADACCLEASELLNQLPVPQTLSSHVQQALPFLYEMRGTLELWTGAGRQTALEMYQQGLTLAEQFQTIEAWCLLLIMRARASLYGLDYHASEQDLHRARTLATQASLGTLVRLSYYGLLDLLLATDRLEEAQQVLKRLKHTGSLADASSKTALHERFQALSTEHCNGWDALYEGKLALVRHDLETADQCFMHASKEARHLPTEYELLLLIMQHRASVALARKNAGQALRLIGDLEEYIPDTFQGLWRGHVLALRAQCMHLFQLPQAARREAEQSRAIFERQGHLIGLQDLDAWWHHVC